MNNYSAFCRCQSIKSETEKVQRTAYNICILTGIKIIIIAIVGYFCISYAVKSVVFRSINYFAVGTPAI